MPRPSDILKGRDRRVVLVGHAPARAVQGVALLNEAPEGDSWFEILERRDRVDGVWLHLQNMELKVSQWFRLEDAFELRIAGNAERIKARQGWAA